MMTHSRVGKVRYSHFKPTSPLLFIKIALVECENVEVFIYLSMDDHFCY